MNDENPEQLSHAQKVDLPDSDLDPWKFKQDSSNAQVSNDISGIKTQLSSITNALSHILGKLHITSTQNSD